MSLVDALFLSACWLLRSLYDSGSDALFAIDGRTLLPSKSHGGLGVEVVRLPRNMLKSAFPSFVEVAQFTWCRTRINPVKSITLLSVD